MKVKLLLSEYEIQEKISLMAKQISADYEGRDPVVLCSLTGAMFFAADLLRQIPYPLEMYAVKLSSYVGNASSGKVDVELFNTCDLRGRCVLVVEDIVETGLTWFKFYELLKEKGCTDYKIASLLVKRQKLQVNLQVDYYGFEIENDYVVGYGLDSVGRGRNLPGIYCLIDD